jgi:uncharacterized DUF497 family protein
MRIVWDEPKRQTALAKGGFDFGRLEPQFFETATATSAREGRFRAIRYVAGTVMVVIIARLGSEAISAISMRRASPRERQTHETEDPAADR